MLANFMVFFIGVVGGKVFFVVVLFIHSLRWHINVKRKTILSQIKNRAHTHTHTHARSHARTHAHTHTHTRIFFLLNNCHHYLVFGIPQSDVINQVTLRVFR